MLPAGEFQFLNLPFPIPEKGRRRAVTKFNLHFFKLSCIHASDWDGFELNSLWMCSSALLQEIAESNAVCRLAGIIFHTLYDTIALFEFLRVAFRASVNCALRQYKILHHT